MFYSCSPSIPFRPLLLSLYIYRCSHKFVSAETTNAKALQWKVYIENDSALSNISLCIRTHINPRTHIHTRTQSMSRGEKEREREREREKEISVVHILL